jgi:hypothetical protein
MLQELHLALTERQELTIRITMNSAAPITDCLSINSQAALDFRLEDTEAPLDGVTHRRIGAQYQQFHVRELDHTLLGLTMLWGIVEDDDDHLVAEARSEHLRLFHFLVDLFYEFSVAVHLDATSLKTIMHETKAGVNSALDLEVWAFRRSQDDSSPSSSLSSTLVARAVYVLIRLVVVDDVVSLGLMLQ